MDKQLLNVNVDDPDEFDSSIARLDFHDIATLFDSIQENKTRAFSYLKPEIQAKVLVVLSQKSKRVIVPNLSDYTLARILSLSDEDDATDTLQFLPEKRRTQILDQIREKTRKKIEKLLKYHPETAGGIMDLNFIVVKPDFTIHDVAEKIHRHVNNDRQIPSIIVADEKAGVVGYLSYKKLILADNSLPVGKLKDKLPTIPHTSSNRTVLNLLTQHHEDVAGVVDDQNRILGIVHMNDLAKIVQIEANASSYRFVGVSRDEYALDPIHHSVAKRYRWLILNLATAFLASAVVALFEGTIQRTAILAAYLPIVAGMGGNAGIQALVVSTRGLALGEITIQHARQLISKEIGVGVINGVITGCLGAIVSILMYGTPLLGAILIISMIANLIIAGLFGAAIPLVLKVMKIDPAIAGSIFLTTATDVFGFIIFLGLSEMML